MGFIYSPRRMAEGGPNEGGRPRRKPPGCWGPAVADTAFLLIVTVRSEGGKRSMTVNLRAPIAIDTGRRAARQCVLSNNAYSVRHPL